MRTTKISSIRALGRSPVAVTAFGALLFAACSSGPSREEMAQANQQMQEENALLQGEIKSRDSLISAMTLSFDDIEKNISLMDAQGRLLSSNVGELEKGGDRREKILKDIQLMNGLLKESQDKVADLTKRLDRSKFETGGLRKKLKSIEVELAARDSVLNSMKDMLAEKDFTIEQVSQQLSAIELEIAKREVVIQQLETEINKAYLAKGTFKELESEGVLTREGGLAGLGGHAVLSDGVKSSQFTTVDVRELKTVPLHVRKATLVTEHPTGSYEIVKEKDELAYLQIKDPDQFWRLSKYLVVEVK